MKFCDEEEDKPLVIAEMDRTHSKKGRLLGMAWKDVHSRLVWFYGSPCVYSVIGVLKHSMCVSPNFRHGICVYIYIYIHLFIYVFIHIYICCIRIHIFYIWYGQRYCSDKLPPKKDLSQHRWSSQYGKRPHDMRAGKGVCEMGVQVCQRGQGKERGHAQSPNRQGTNGHRHTPSHCMWTSIWQHVYRVCN